MTLCSDNHDEVCYEGRHCPVCAVKRDLEDSEDVVSQLEEELEDLKSRQ